MCAVGKETSKLERRYCLRWKLFWYSLPSHLKPETFVSPSALCLCFFFFVFVFWSIEITAANLQGLTHSNPSKSTNQAILSNEHLNHLFWVEGNLVHYRINLYFLVFIFCRPKEGPAWLIAQRQWHSWYDILKNKKIDVKKLIPKISEEFTIVTTLRPQMLGFKGSRYAPVYYVHPHGTFPNILWSFSLFTSHHLHLEYIDYYFDTVIFVVLLWSVQKYLLLWCKKDRLYSFY